MTGYAIRAPESSHISVVLANSSLAEDRGCDSSAGIVHAREEGKSEMSVVCPRHSTLASRVPSSSRSKTVLRGVRPNLSSQLNEPTCMLSVSLSSVLHDFAMRDAGAQSKPQLLHCRSMACALFPAARCHAAMRSDLANQPPTLDHLLPSVGARGKERRPAPVSCREEALFALPTRPWHILPCPRPAL